MKRSLSASLTLIVLFFVAVGLAAPKTITLPPDNALADLKPGPGVEAVRANCGLCHSTDYIVRQQGGDASHWEPEVRKMAATYGAVLSDDEVKTIVNYLATAYGSQSAEAGKQNPAASKSKTQGGKHN